MPQAEPEERVIYPDPEIERDVYVRPAPNPTSELHSMFGVNSLTEQQHFMDLLNTMRQEQANNPDAGAGGAFPPFGDMDGASAFFSNMNANDSPKVEETRLQKYLKTKIHIGLLSILTYLLINLTSYHCNAFIIFLVWEIIEMFLLRQHENSGNGIANMIFMVAGMSPTKMNMVLKWIQLLNKVLRDVAIFVFFFVITHICYMSWNGISLIPTAKESHMTDKLLQMQSADDFNDEDVFEKFDL